MPRPRLKVTLEGSGPALTAVRDSIETQLASQTIHDRPIPYTTERLPGGGFRAVLDVRFSLDGLDALRDWFIANKAAIRAAGITGTANVHQCSHDDAVPHNCRDAPDFREVLI